MGHAIDTLTFDLKTSKNKIQDACDKWGDWHCDPYERGGIHGGLGANIKFYDKVFDSLESAKEYLIYHTDRNCAVKYKEYPPVVFTKAMIALEGKIVEYKGKIKELNKPHYKGVKQATVKCKHCGSSLSTAYCGAYSQKKYYVNDCPVCGADLRPQTVLDKIKGYEDKISEIEKKLKEEEKKQNTKNDKKVVIKWAVCCDVHH